jgi:cell division protein FtsN
VAPPPPPANAPLSLSPGANYAPPPMPAQASAPPAPPPVSRAPTRLASAPTASAGGRYLVQVSSQRSEADAEASFRNIQTRYSGVLGGQPHVVRRANLGSRGTYYRAMVGPFATRDQAIQLCSSLKAAGGDCVVQTN